MIARKIFVAFILLASLLVALILNHAKPSFKSDPNPIVIRIEKGWTLKHIAQVLRDQNVIQSQSFFKVLGKMSGQSNRFKYGTYRFERNRYWKILSQLGSGQTYKIKATIPEGWTAWQVGVKLTELGILSEPDSLVRLARDKKLEGMLFPDTYFFEPQSDSQTITSTMLEQFKKNFSPAFEERARTLRLSPQQIVTLASIIEREARADEERAQISAVYHNRLKRRMPLEADPTVQYALSQGQAWKERLTYKDLKMTSPYNTYRVQGLPPGPICSPGLKSIQAALYPENTGNLYFVADGTGRHVFSKTYSDHLKAVAISRRNARREAVRTRKP